MDLLVLAQETAEHAEETSKASYYILGSILAVWAVIIAFVGITQPGFPDKIGGRQAVIGFTGLLVAATATAAVLTG